MILSYSIPDEIVEGLKEGMEEDGKRALACTEKGGKRARRRLTCGAHTPYTPIIR
jgi:hypothetical protein